MENKNVLYVIEGGYLDVGIIDTMKGLLVNFIGAVVFSIIGYFYLIGRSKGKFIPQYTPKAANACDDKDDGHEEDWKQC